MARIEIEEDYPHDAIVDVADGRGVGVNGPNLTDCVVSGNESGPNLKSPFRWSREPILVVYRAQPKQRYRLFVNGKALGAFGAGAASAIGESVHQFVTDLEPLYARDRDRLRFVPFPEAGHGVTDGMWKEAREWIVQGLQNIPPSGAGRQLPSPQPAVSRRKHCARPLDGQSPGVQE
jgi:hypothetical protein